MREREREREEKKTGKFYTLKENGNMGSKLPGSH